MTASALRIEADYAVARLILTQAERGNPIDGLFCAEWSEAGVQLSSDSAARAILLSAEGRNFSVGGDIELFNRNLDDLPQQIKRWAADFHSGVARLQRADPPLVAAVHGVCAGGAVSIIAGADYVVAEEGARFVSAYTGLGYSCDGGATVMLSRRMGEGRSKRFLLMGETLTAHEALAAGLVDELVPAPELETRARKIAGRLAAGPTKAFGELKRLFAAVRETSLDTQLEMEALALARCAGSDDAREAITAFIEKRRPAFTGR